MEWVRSNPYRAALVGAFLLVALGGFIVFRRGPAAPSNDPLAWGGASLPVIDPANPQNPVLQEPRGSTTSGGRDVPITTYGPSQQAGSDSSDDQGFDFDTFLAQLTQPTNNSTDTSVETGTKLQYSFIPQGFISTSTQGKVYSAAQQALFNYGNEVGGYIQSHEDRHRNDSIALKNQAEDRTDPAKGAAVKAIGADLKALGASLHGFVDVDDNRVPEVMRHAHQALADSYIEIGAKLQAIPDAEGDQAFIAAIYAYNAAADTFMTNYLAMATLFAVNGITFSENDAGNVFSFSGGGF